MSSTHFLSDQKSLEDLFSRMVSPDREQCAEFKSLKVEPSFVDRIFIVYKPTGLHADGQHKHPEILTKVKVLSFRADDKHGAEAEIQDMVTHEVMTVGYIPRRMFGYDAFVSIAPRQRLNWDAVLLQGRIKRTLSFMLMFKLRSASENYSYGCTGVETPAKFRELYPSVHFNLND